MDAQAVYPRPCLGEQLSCLGIMDVDPGAVQAVERRLVNSFDLIIGKYSELRRLLRVIVGFHDHRLNIKL